MLFRSGQLLARVCLLWSSGPGVQQVRGAYLISRGSRAAQLLALSPEDIARCASHILLRTVYIPHLQRANIGDLFHPSEAIEPNNIAVTVPPWVEAVLRAQGYNIVNQPQNTSDSQRSDPTRITISNGNNDFDIEWLVRVYPQQTAFEVEVNVSTPLRPTGESPHDTIEQEWNENEDGSSSFTWESHPDSSVCKRRFEDRVMVYMADMARISLRLGLRPHDRSGHAYHLLFDVIEDIGERSSSRSSSDPLTIGAS